MHKTKHLSSLLRKIDFVAKDYAGGQSMHFDENLKVLCFRFMGQGINQCDVDYTCSFPLTQTDWLQFTISWLRLIRCGPSHLAFSEQPQRAVFSHSCQHLLMGNCNKNLGFAVSQFTQRVKNDPTASHPSQLEDPYYSVRLIYVYIERDRKR